jgi:hypothetical protein
MRSGAPGGRAGGSPSARRAPGGREPGRACHQHDQRERHAQHLERDERGERQPDVQRRGERAPADAQQRLQHQRQHRGLQSEQHAVGHRQVTEAGVRPGQPEQQHHRRANEAEPGHQAAAHAVQLPAEVDRELQRLGPGQQHAEVERAGEIALIDPAAPLDHLAVQDRDLAGGPAE